MMKKSVPKTSDNQEHNALLKNALLVNKKIERVARAEKIDNSNSKKNYDEHAFRENGFQMIDYLIHYLENQNQHKPFENIQPGYLKHIMPTQAPYKKESFEAIMLDFKEKIIPGMTHWNHPHFHAYYPASNSYPGLLGEMLSSGIGCVGFTWAASPACTELEVLMLDWLGKLINLPEDYLSNSQKGGGVIMNTCSEATLISVYAARTKVLNRVREQNPELSNFEILAKLRGYYSIEAHTSVARAALLTMLDLKPIQSRKEDNSMDTERLREQIEQDISCGYIPFYVCATLGTTSTCAFDRLWEIGPICKQNDLWLHVDASYAAAAFICPEHQHYMKGVEHTDSFVFSPKKWMLVNQNCSAMWFRNTDYVIKSFTIESSFLKYKEEGKMPDFRHWHIGFGRKFESLKIWFVLRLYGVEGIREYIRNHIQLAKYFETLLIKDGRFEIVQPVKMGLVCFRLKGDNISIERLYDQIRTDNRLHLVPSTLNDGPPKTFFIRFVMCHEHLNSTHVDSAYDIISELANEILN